MEYRFDAIAKAVSGAMSRREAFWRVGSGLGLGVLAFLGLGSGGQDNCAHCCAACCINLDPPPRGHDLAVCITDCHDGAGLCGHGQCAPLCIG